MNGDIPIVRITEDPKFDCGCATPRHLEIFGNDETKIFDIKEYQRSCCTSEEHFLVNKL